MSMTVWPSSPLDAAQRAFELLVCQPASLAFDGRPFIGLPEQLLPLDELRELLLLPQTAVPVRDAVWRELVTRARRDGLPVLPWDHPDLVLARAVAAGVLEPEEAALIGATRLGKATLAQAGRPLDMDPAQAGAWRRKAELRLRDAVHAGELDYVSITSR